MKTLSKEEKQRNLVQYTSPANVWTWSWSTSPRWVDTWARDMVMWYWSVTTLFWQLSIVHIVNVQCKRCGFTKTLLRQPSLPFDSLPYPARTICRRVRTLGQSRDTQTKRGWPYSMSMGLGPTGAKRAWEPCYKGRFVYIHTTKISYF